MKDRQQTIRGRLVVTDLIVQELSSGVVIHVVNRETWVEWRTSSLQLEFRVFIKYETAELYRRPDIPYGHQLISDHLVPCMVSTELHCLCWRCCHPKCPCAIISIKLHDKIFQYLLGKIFHYLLVITFQFLLGNIFRFFNIIFTLSGRLSEPPISSPVQLESVGLCIQLSGIIMTLIIIIIFSDSWLWCSDPIPFDHHRRTTTILT